jgi:hypothetical protein
MCCPKTPSKERFSKFFAMTCVIWRCTSWDVYKKTVEEAGRRSAASTTAEDTFASNAAEVRAGVRRAAHNRKRTECRRPQDGFA